MCAVAACMMKGRRNKRQGGKKDVRQHQDSPFRVGVRQNMLTYMYLTCTFHGAVHDSVHDVCLLYIYVLLCIGFIC